MEAELTYLFLLVVLIAVPLCQIGRNTKPSHRARRRSRCYGR